MYWISYLWKHITYRMSPPFTEQTERDINNARYWSRMELDGDAWWNDGWPDN